MLVNPRRYLRILPSSSLKESPRRGFFSPYPRFKRNAPAPRCNRRDSCVCQPADMKKLPVAIVLAAAMSGAYANPHAPQEFDFSELGTVESVRQVEVVRQPLADVFEHAVRADTGAQLQIRLDSGRGIMLVEGGMQRFEAGQRVRVVSGSTGTRVSYE